MLGSPYSKGEFLAVSTRIPLLSFWLVRHDMSGFGHNPSVLYVAPDVMYLVLVLQLEQRQRQSLRRLTWVFHPEPQKTVQGSVLASLISLLVPTIRGMLTNNVRFGVYPVRSLIG